MTTTLVAHLGPAEIGKLSSHYLNEGRKQESWRIEGIEITDNRLDARVSMSSTYVSGSDSQGFHLTIFSTLEFLSQLMILYAHVWAGLPEKRREGWMVESSTRSLRAIRSAENIRVEMTVLKMRKRGENLYCVADYRVTDDRDGIFEARLKGFLS
jgi:hypothetical protein